MKNLRFLTRRACFRLLALMLCLAASIPQMRADVTIFVRGTAPYLYVFNVEGTAPTDGTAKWPGKEMTLSTTAPDGTTWYYAHYTGLNSCSIIFNNGNSGENNQTEDITNVSGTTYFYSNGSAKYMNLTTVMNANHYVFYENSNGWSEPIKAHCWDGNYSTNWPGDQMTAVGRVSRSGNKIYLWSNPTNAPGMIIFNGNNATSQTGDLQYVDGGYYSGSGNNPSTDYQSIAYPTLPSYVVAGPSSIFGSEWDGSSTANTMTLGSDSKYTLSLSNVSLAASVYNLFKVVANGTQWIGDPNNNGENFTFVVPQNGTYDISFTFDPATSNCTVQYQLLNATGGEIYTVAGNNTAILGEPGWDATNTANDMTLQADGTYRLTISNVTLSDNPSCSFKVAVNHSWGISHPSQDASVTGFNGSGDYNIVFTFDPSTNAVSGVATKLINYYAVGGDTSIFPNGWSTGSGTEMTDNGDGTYSWTSAQVHLNAGTNYTYKVLDSDGNWHPSGDNLTFSVNVPGTYTVTVTLDSSTGTVNATTTLIAADGISNVYLIGNADTQQWAANAGIKMGLDNETGYYTLKRVVLTANSYFALATTLGANAEDWATLNANRISSTGQSHWAISDNWLGQWMDTQGYTDDHHNWYVERSGAYDMYFNPNTRQFMVERSNDRLFISYGVNWDYDNNSVEMTSVDGNVYQATITLNKGDYFLFSTDKSDATAIGATDDGYEITDLMIGFAQALKVEGNTNNYHFTGATGKYLVVVNLEKKTVTIRKTADATVTKIFLEKTDNVVLDPAGGTYNHQTLEGVRGGIYAWNKLNLQTQGGRPYEWAPNDGPTNYTYANEVPDNYGGNNYLKDLPDTTTVDGKQWYAWSVSNSICEFYFIRSNKDDKKSQKIIRRSGEIWLTWTDLNATSNRQDDAAQCDSLLEVTRNYFDVSAGGVGDCETMLEDHYYVYYTNTTGWDSVYCYAWYEVGEDVIRFTNVYPGNKCTFVGYDENGYEVWCYDFGLIEDFHNKYGTDPNNPDEYLTPTNVIFDNGKGGANEGAEGDKVREQTGDLVFDNGACYDYLGMIYLGNSLNAIINGGIVNGPKYTVEDDLIGVYYDENAVTRIYEYLNGEPVIDEQTGEHKYIEVWGALYAKDFENYSVKSMQPEGTTDYVYDICAHTPSPTYPGGSQIQLKRTYYDQSNWVKIVLSPNFDNTTALQNSDVTYQGAFDDEDFEKANDQDRNYLKQFEGKIIPGGSMSGNLVNNVNPQMHITNIALPLATEEYEKNVYITGHFNDSIVFNYVHQEWSPGLYQGVHRTVPVAGTDENNNTIVDHMWVSPEVYKMFYVAPKPQEVAYITWAVFDHPDPNVGTPNCVQEPDEPGAFYGPMNWDRTGQLWDGTNPDDPDGAWGTTYGPYSNGYMQYGAFQVNWSLFEGMEIPLGGGQGRPQEPWYRIFKSGQAYKILAIIRYAHDEDGNVEYKPGVYKGNNYNNGETNNHVANAPRRANNTYADMKHVPYDRLNDSKFIIFPLLGSSEDSKGDVVGNVTAVKEVVTTRTIVDTSYYNLMGVKSDQPFDGLNIVVTTYSDGSRTSKKILR